MKTRQQRIAQVAAMVAEKSRYKKAPSVPPEAGPALVLEIKGKSALERMIFLKKWELKELFKKTEEECMKLYGCDKKTKIFALSDFINRSENIDFYTEIFSRKERKL